MRHNVFQLCSFFSLIYPVYGVAIQQGPSEYGPYKANLLSLTQCRANSSESKHFNVTVSTRHSEQYMYFIMDVPKEASHVTVFRWQNRSFIPLVRYTMKNPCDHFFMGPIFKTFMNVTDTCAIKKGTYVASFVFDKILHQFLGEKFFYGEFMYKSKVGSNKFLVICTETHFTLGPAGNNTDAAE